MAKKPGTAQEETSSARGDAGRRIVEAAQALLVDTPWHRIALADIALKADVPLSELYRRYPLRPMLMAAVLRAIDMTALEQPIETDGTARERLLESLMRRLDALRPFRQGMRATARDLRSFQFAALPEALMSAIHGNYVLGWYIEAAGIPVQGLTGLARVKLVSIAWVSALKTWLDDESEDDARSMAALDRALGRIWSLMRVDEPRPEAEDEEGDVAGDPQPSL